MNIERKLYNFVEDIIRKENRLKDEFEIKFSYHFRKSVETPTLYFKSINTKPELEMVLYLFSESEEYLLKCKRQILHFIRKLKEDIMIRTMFKLEGCRLCIHLGTKMEESLPPYIWLKWLCIKCPSYSNLSSFPFIKEMPCLKKSEWYNSISF